MKKSIKVKRIVTGGQSGSDRAALETAVRLGIEYSGYCPRGGWAEDFEKPPGIRNLYPLLKETKSSDPKERTVLNARNSDASLVFFEKRSPGTKLTKITAEKAGKPVFSFDEKSTADEVIEWLSSLKDSPALNIAGPRESEYPGIKEITAEILEKVLCEKK